VCQQALLLGKGLLVEADQEKNSTGAIGLYGVRQSSRRQGQECRGDSQEGGGGPRDWQEEELD